MHLYRDNLLSSIQEDVRVPLMQSIDLMIVT